MIADAAAITAAIAVLRAGGLVAFPTETVYGLGADASNPSAVGKVFSAKGRPRDHPLIVHLADVAQLVTWACDVPAAAHQLAKRFWPGPLTMVLKRSPAVLDVVTGGQDTVAVRVPAHPVAQALLRGFGGGIAAPSANRFGHVSATTAEHVRQEFGSAVACVLDGGEADVGIESTIIDLSGDKPILLRPGWISVHEVASVVGVTPEAPTPLSPRAPGTLAKHYAPQTSLMMMEADLLTELAASLARQGKRVAVLARSTRQPLLDGLAWISAPESVAGYAHQLYANLRQLDGAGCDVILVEAPPQQEAWLAVSDRLMRAATGSAPSDEP